MTKRWASFLPTATSPADLPPLRQGCAYGDQCEACGTSLSPTDLVNPKSALSGSVPVMKETKHWYLPLDKWDYASQVDS